MVSLRSMPEQNVGPLACRRMAPTERSASALSKASTNMRQCSMQRALRLSVRSSVILATRPSCFTSINFHLHAQQSRAISFALGIHPERYCPAAPERFVQQQIDSAEVRQLEPFHLASNEVSEELFHTFGGYFAE